MHISRTIFLSCLFCWALNSTVARAEEWSVSELMEAMSQTRMARAKFVEQKNISMLEQPIESSGELFYTAPDRLEKRTLQPKAESMQLEGSTLWIISEGKSHVLQLSRYPEIAAFIDSIRGLLSGDRKALERSYQLQLSGKKTAWTLILEPKNPRVQKVLLRIEIEGAQTTLRNILIEQADGDSSSMKITPVSSR